MKQGYKGVDQAYHFFSHLNENTHCRNCKRGERPEH